MYIKAEITVAPTIKNCHCDEQVQILTIFIHKFLEDPVVALPLQFLYLVLPVRFQFQLYRKPF